jgi:antirestriction protein ArdC
MRGGRTCRRDSYVLFMWRIPGQAFNCLCFRLFRLILSPPFPSVYGPRDYCKEELVAEIATCFLYGEAGIANTVIENSSAYIRFWIERLSHILRENNKAFVRASAVAQKATDFILNRVEEPVVQE